MADLIELIFSNFVIVAAIIGGIISWFSGMSKEKDQKSGAPKKQTAPRPYPNKSQGEPQQQEQEGQEDRGGRLREYYEEKQKRLEEIAEKSRSDASGYNRDRTITDSPVYNAEKSSPMEENPPAGRKASTKAPPLTTDGPLVEQARKWDKKKLAEGIVMAEILGPPRAHKPHRSHPRKR
ncbi:hypothetical protein GLW04_07960 [Halobacillus litoralis]|uniref:Uncharacterized protein n=1 Tax=Halobacillus litoralis TaxID=45668 RepID=A0A845E0L4_9BACI|nr:MULTISPECIES: hypothetical protein [Halobacillus]MCA1021426.1 hypothetical protein [Halobacillus litoralis]MYL19817.1 hypothetical protein [Halobacillus litoralis]MYL28963.1 hypothetical protein [Halobacillus halophilus]MYL37214.1 hypothetical protein [Halobacillus litoralis]